MFRKQTLQLLLGIILLTTFVIFLFIVDIYINQSTIGPDLLNLPNQMKKLESEMHKINTSLIRFQQQTRVFKKEVKSDNKLSIDRSNGLKSDCTYVLVILVTSHAANASQRQLIRKTWGMESRREVFSKKTFFVVGNWNNISISDEIATYGDIIESNAEEDFYNLIPKLKASFKFATKYCNFNYLLKTDEDVFVNIQRLFIFLMDPSIPKKELYAGNVNYQAKVQRKGRYAISANEYGKVVYPRYCSGGGFVISRDTADRFVKYIDDVSFIKIDDAFLGELALKAGIDTHHNENFKMFEKSDLIQCKFNFKTIVHHPVKTKWCMKILYDKMKTM